MRQAVLQHLTGILVYMYGVTFCVEVCMYGVWYL